MFLFCREYPCDHYTSVINVTLLMTGCPRVDVHTTAVQLLQVLDKRFFGNVGPLQSEADKGMCTKLNMMWFFVAFPKPKHTHTATQPHFTHDRRSFRTNIVVFVINWTKSKLNLMDKSRQEGYINILQSCGQRQRVSRMSLCFVGARAAWRNIPLVSLTTNQIRP